MLSLRDGRVAGLDATPPKLVAGMMGRAASTAALAPTVFPSPSDAAARVKSQTRTHVSW